MNRFVTNITIHLFIGVLLLGGALACSGPGGRDTETAVVTPPSGVSDEQPTIVGIVPTASAGVPTTDPVATAAGDQPSEPVDPGLTATTPLDPASATAVPETPTTMAVPTDGLLPNNRIISYYGHPNSTLMGILGEGSKDDALALLREQGAAFAAADPSTPVVLAFELIATVAQASPGDDGKYIAYTGDEIIQEYLDYVTANNLILILDIQIGLDTLPNQIEIVRKWLEYPNVHLAIDPEFSMRANEVVPTDRVPGTFIGEVGGDELNVAMQMVSEIVAANGLPSKIVMVHQFESDMIYNKDAIVVPANVDFVLDMDGFGGMDAKVSNYGHFVRDELIEYGGIKLFYQQDDPVMTPEQIVVLDPPPLVVIYQ